MEYKFKILLVIFATTLTLSNAQTFSPSDFPIFNKETEEIISDIEFQKIISKNPRVALEPKIDKYGNVSSYELDLKNETGRVYLDISSRTKNGEKSPPFVMTDFKGNQIDSDELIGEIVIIQFHLGFDSPMHNDNHLKAYDKLISNITHNRSIVSLLVTKSDTDQVSNFENRTQYSTPIIPNGGNFMKRYKISSYPSFMLVDQDGILVKYLDDWNLDEVKNELLKL